MRLLPRPCLLARFQHPGVLGCTVIAIRGGKRISVDEGVRRAGRVSAPCNSTEGAKH